ncbi:MAG: hypothetical protein WCK31_02460 [bacterium]
MTKFKKTYEEMTVANKQLFEEFTKIHDAYAKNSKKNQDEFNIQGARVLRVIKDYETRLCGKSENSGFGLYSSKLSEKFWLEIRTHYKYIDMVGVKIK